MRLTLRTLLAYMDDILEEEDKKTLKAKIDESAFATDLIAKIRQAVEHPSLSAHSPDAVGPLENANVISEYLDSTLAPEQITEIERHCLESGVSLAEAAACHQILTVALGESAQVPVALKYRLYQLPQSAPISPSSPTELSGAAFSDVDVPGDGPGSDAGLPDAATAIRPVGPDDSGVSDAPTRLRNAPGAADERTEAEIVADATRAALADSDGYGGTVRTSRIAPWLMTLAMTAVVLYALAQIFSPLTNSSERPMGAVAIDEEPFREPGPVEPGPEDSATEPVVSESTEDMDSGTGTASASPSVSGPQADDSESPMAASQPDAVVATVSKESGTEADVPSEVEPPMPTKTDPAKNSDPEEAEPEMAAADSTKAEVVASDSKPAEKKAVPPKARAIVATLEKDGSLVLVQRSMEAEQGVWSRLLPSAEDGAVAAVNPNATVVREVRSGQEVIAPALYRPVLNHSDGLEWTLAGPTRMRLEADPAGGAMTRLINGRVLLASTQAGASTTVQLGKRVVQVVMPAAQTVLAIELIYRRPVGADPLVATNRIPFYRIISVQGEARIQPTKDDTRPNEGGDDSADLKTGKQWGGRGVSPAVVADIDRLPEWTDPPAKADALVQSARSGLLDFMSETDPLEKSLREAMAFRRVEVAALAAETLLLLGRADVYFGADGILSRPRQRLYWTEHFDMLRQYIASSDRAAQEVNDAIGRAELADRDNIFRLLVGFSQTQLENGGDAKLVELLDSPSMPVRVLAIENLKSIVGDTLGFRADTENANSRKADIKKWEAKVRRGDIRYAGK